MDPITAQTIATVLVAIAFAGVCWWAFHPARKERFEQDAKLPFVDEDEGHDQGSGKGKDGQ